MKVIDVMKGFVLIGLVLGVTSGSLACPKKGTMEKAGEAVDEAVDDAGREIEDATD